MKKLISLIICVCLIIGTIPFSIFAQEALEVWDGSIATDYSDFSGSGTKDDPYLIENGAQLAFAVSKNPNLDDGSYFKLTKDIVLNDTSVEGWKDTATPWIWNNHKRFNGTLDGDGHTIEGLYMNSSSANGRIGLFAYVGKTASVEKIAEIKNLYFKGASITSTKSVEGVAIVVGQTSGEAHFDNIYIDETSEIYAPYATGVGALASRGYNNGNNAGVVITNCASHANIIGKSAVGAFTGTYWASDAFVKINGSYTTSNFPLSGNKSLTDSENNYGPISNESGTIVVTASQIIGDSAKTAMSGLDYETLWQTVENGYPVQKIFVSDDDNDDQEQIEPPLEPDNDWDGSVEQSLDSFEGSGAEADPYLIKTPAQLAYIVSTDLVDGLYFKLANDIIINDTSVDNWRASAKNWVWCDIRFVGNFDGDGHTIEGLYFNGSQKRMGLFSYVGDSLFKNVKFKGAYINNVSSEEGTGILVGQASAPATFETIYIDETSKLTAPNARGVAGIVGRGNQDVNIENSVVLATISGKSHVGAFFGTFWGGNQTITNCFTASNVPVIASYTPIVTNTYATVKTEDNYYDRDVVLLTPEEMKGEAAKENMFELDFDTIFKTVDGGYPVIELRERAPEPIVPALPDYVWDGTAAESFAGGTGSKEEPFLIDNAEQLYKMVVEYSNREASLGKYFKITNDIYLNDVEDGTLLTALEYKQNWLGGYGTDIPTALKANSFSGTLDGDNHTIYGLYAVGIKSAGLFPALSSGVEIKNLAFNNLYITGGSGCAGAIAGQLIYADWTLPNKFTNCSVVNATIGEVGNIENVGGLVGDIQSCSATITNCYSYNLNLSDKAVPGGLIGNAWDNVTFEIVKSYSVGYFPTRSNVSKAVCTDVYTDTAAPEGNTTENVTVLTSEQMKGEAAKTNMKGFDFERFWQTRVEDYPVCKQYVRPDYVWDGTKAESFAGGSGTETDPYLIENGAQLYKMVAEFSNASSAVDAVNAIIYFKLVNDIYLNDVQEQDLENPSVAQWNSIFNSWYKVTSYSNGFCGDLDGAGYTVYGLYSNGGYSGLIPVFLDGGRIHNLNIKNSYVYGTDSAGGIVGFAKSHWKMAPVAINYCSVDNLVLESKNTYVGGFVGGYGDAKVNIANCFITNTELISTNENPNLVSGFVGKGWGATNNIINCYTDSSVHPVTKTTDEESFNDILDNSIYKNVYTSAEKNFDANGVIYLAEEQMKGENAKTYMSGLNFADIWETVDNDYPAIQADIDSVCAEGHTYLSVCEECCTVCLNFRVAPHAKKGDCSSYCPECESYIPSTAEHQYDNACDSKCNVCETIRVPADHVYDNDYDINCNVCGNIREVPPLPDGTPKFSVTGATARLGKTFTLEVSVSDNPGICALEISVGYDANQLELVSSVGGVFAGTSFGPTTNNPFKMTWVSALSENTTNGVVATLTFKVKEDAQLGKTAIILSYDPNNVYDFNFENVDFETESGIVNIIDYTPGDVNDDGAIDNKDVGLLSRFVNGWDEDIMLDAADVNKDGFINNRDIGILQRYICGWDVELK